MNIDDEERIQTINTVDYLRTPCQIANTTININDDDRIQTNNRVDYLRTPCQIADTTINIDDDDRIQTNNRVDYLRIPCQIANTTMNIDDDEISILTNDRVDHQRTTSFSLDDLYHDDKSTCSPSPLSKNYPAWSDLWVYPLSQLEYRYVSFA